MPYSTLPITGNLLRGGSLSWGGPLSQEVGLGRNKKHGAVFFVRLLQR